MAGGFHKLERIVSLEVTYKTHGYVSVHTGLGDSVHDNLVIREGGEDSRPIIPGSSIKGVVRSLVESILAQAGKQICVPFPCSPTERRAGRIEHIPIAPRLTPCDWRNAQPCHACQLFGNTQQRSRVTFHDAKTILSAEEVTTLTRRHVAIDREKGTQFGGALMAVEAVPGDELEFVSLVTLINPDPWMVGAVRETLPLLRHAGVGARKSRGYGDLIVTPGAVKFVLHPANDLRTEAVYQEECIQRWQAERATVTLGSPERSVSTSGS
ncbi:MAG: hypothetical protein HY268_11375 [Deltaproteobacteria bacterium]|nr:hypothetical protein [Deltaproteobacteria bacterium]